MLFFVMCVWSLVKTFILNLTQFKQLSFNVKTSDRSAPPILASKNLSISVKTNRTIFITILIFIGILWGATIPLAKVAVSSGHAPLGITFWEQLIVTVVLGVVLVARSIIFRRRLRVPLNHDAIVYYITIAALGAILPNLFSYWAMSQLPAGIMAIIVASVPMFALAIAMAASIETLVPYRVLGRLPWMRSRHYTGGTRRESARS